MEILIGYRDPNYVAIKDFYESTFNLNYFSLFAKDDKPIVREEFLNVLEDWLINLPDKEDHFARLIPYLLTSLFDSNEDIQERAVEVLEEMGKKVEREKEETFREEKQYGVQSFWCKSYGNEVDKVKLSPFRKRARIGIRFLIQNSLSKLVPPIKRELRDSINFEFKLKTLQLLKFIMFMVEDSIVEHVSGLLTNFIKNLKYDQKGKLKEQIGECCLLIGRYTRFDQVFEIIKPYMETTNSLFAHCEESTFLFEKILQGNFENIGSICLQQNRKELRMVLQFMKDNDLLNYSTDMGIVVSRVKMILDTVSDEIFEELKADYNELVLYVYHYNMVKEVMSQQEVNKTKQTRSFDYTKLLSDIVSRKDSILSDSIEYKCLAYLAFTQTDKEFLITFLDITMEKKMISLPQLGFLASLFKKQKTIITEAIFHKFVNYAICYMDVMIKNKKQVKKEEFAFYISLLDWMIELKEVDDFTSFKELMFNFSFNIKTIITDRNTQKNFEENLQFIERLLKIDGILKNNDYNKLFSIYDEFIANSFFINEISPLFDKTFELLSIIMIKARNKLEKTDFETKILDTYYKLYNQLNRNENREK